MPDASRNATRTGSENPSLGSQSPPDTNFRDVQEMEAGGHDNSSTDSASPDTRQHFNSALFDRETSTGTKGTQASNASKKSNASRASQISRKHTASAENMEDIIDNIRWFSGTSPKRHQFVETFTEALRYTNLSGRAKFLIRERFLGLYAYYYKRRQWSNCISIISSVYVTIGSILVPIILTIGDKIANDSVVCDKNYLYLYILTVLLSFSISVVQSLTDIFQTTRTHYSLVTTLQLLDFEGWCFIYLEGYYSVYKNHQDCWRQFLYRTEQLNYETTNKIVSMHYNINLNDQGEEKQTESSNDAAEVGNLTLEQSAPSTDLHSFMRQAKTPLYHDKIRVFRPLSSEKVPRESEEKTIIFVQD